MNRRELIRASASLAAAAIVAPLLRAQAKPLRREFNIRDYGAVGDGTTLDTAAIQRAIDAAGAVGDGARVLVPGGKRFLVGALQLTGSIEFHLADDAELLVSTDPKHFAGRALLNALDATGLRLTGTGRVNGRSREFMDHFDEKDEWWRPKAFRPRLAVLTGCKDLEVRDVTFFEAPSWTLHLVGCQRVLVDRVKIRNQLDVPNCDGIDPDHCRDVEIKNCNIVCGDDAIVVKTSRQGAAYGGSANISVCDCVIETQDSAVKIGTETVADIQHIRFERCTVKSCCRGCTIQLRDEGSVSDVEFRDITFAARHFSAPWWGRGEAISFTAIPRTPETKVGTLSAVRVINVTGRAENSARLSGSPASRVRDVRFENVAVTLERWTKYPGGVWDNRPTSTMPDLEPHGTPGFSVRHADRVALKNCRVAWGKNPPDEFTHALEIEDSTEIDHSSFVCEAAHPKRDPAIAIH